MKHSYTSLSMYARCPRWWQAKYIERSVPYETSPQMERGNAIHKQLEDALLAREPVPPVPVDRGLWTALVSYPDLRVEHKLDSRKLTGKLDVLLLDKRQAVAIDWKGLPLDTEIPTPSGWTTMGNLRIGDNVYDAQGKACRVIGKSKEKRTQCLRLVFDDTSEVVADTEHRWVLVDGSVLTTECLKVGNRMPVALPLDGDAKLPVHPYVLGAWLGDGRCRGGEITKPDADFWILLSRFWAQRVGADYNRNNPQRCRTSSLFGLTKELRKLGVLGNKHIPAIYLRASQSDRLHLLRGLLDSDGNVNPTRKQAVFTTTAKKLSDDVLELLLSLGQRPLQSKTKQCGFGRPVTAWPISFRPLNGLQPFGIRRKARRCVSQEWGNGASSYRRLVEIRQEGSCMTQCIEVDSPSSTYLCTKKFLPTHNSGKYNPDPLQADVYATLTRQSTLADSFELTFVYVDLEKHSPVYKPDASATDRVMEMVARCEADKTCRPKPGFYCKWCPVHSCRYNGRNNG